MPGSGCCAHQTTSSSACSIPTARTRIGDGGSYRAIDNTSQQIQVRHCAMVGKVPGTDPCTVVIPDGCEEVTA
jgi:hypothetical protein